MFSLIWLPSLCWDHQTHPVEQNVWCYLNKKSPIQAKYKRFPNWFPNPQARKKIGYSCWGGGVLFSLLKHLCIRWKSYTKELNRKYCSKEWISKGIPAFSIILKPFIDYLLCPRHHDMLHGLYRWILTKILGDSHEVSCRRTVKLGDVVCKRPCDLLKATQAAVAEITNYSKDCALNWACAILMPEP